MNKLILAILILLVSFSCSRDELANCDCDGKVNSLCREVIFNNNEYIGYIQYSYNNFDSISSVNYYSNTSNSTKNITFSYDSLFRVADKKFTNNNAFYDELKFQYSNNKISTVNYLKNNTCVYKDNYIYENNLLKKIEFTSTAAIDSSINYIYYSDNKLKKENHIDNNGFTKGYKIFEYFSNDTDKMSVYNSKDSLMESYTYRKNNGNIIETIYSRNGMSNTYESFKYYTNGLLSKKHCYNEKGKEIKRIHYSYTEN